MQSFFFFLIFDLIDLFIWLLMSQLRHVGSSALRPGSKPGPPHWELSILAAGPPGNSLGVRSHKKDLYIQVVFTEWKKPVGVYPGDSGAHLLPHP